MEKIKITKEQAEELFRREISIMLDAHQLDSIFSLIPFSPLIGDLFTNLRSNIGHSTLRFYLLLGEEDTRKLLYEGYKKMKDYLSSVQLEDFEESTSLPNDIEFIIDDEIDFIEEQIKWYKYQESRNIFQESNIFELIK